VAASAGLDGHFRLGRRGRLAARVRPAEPRAQHDTLRDSPTEKPASIRPAALFPATAHRVQPERRKLHEHVPPGRQRRPDSRYAQSGCACDGAARTSRAYQCCRVELNGGSHSRCDSSPLFWVAPDAGLHSGRLPAAFVGHLASRTRAGGVTTERELAIELAKAVGQEEARADGSDIPGQNEIAWSPQIAPMTLNIGHSTPAGEWIAVVMGKSIKALKV
jgi:hypothetical protein